MKKVLVITTSPRLRSNSDALAEEFARGAREAGHAVEVCSLRGKDIRFCQGCLSCMKTNRCIIKDDAAQLVEKMGQADVLVFATPVYYFGMSGQMKTMLDRANPLYTADYKFREVYLLAAAAEDEEDTVKGTEDGVKNWVLCFEKAAFVKTAFAGGVDAPATIKGHKALAEAYALGKQV